MTRTDSASGYRYSAIATLAAACAGITMLSGVSNIGMTPLPTAFTAWPRTAASIQSWQHAAINDWSSVVYVLAATLLAIAAINALVALFAHATARRYEVALSAVVGATRRDLMLVQLRNAAVNAGAALLLGLPIGLLCAIVANRTWPQVSHGIGASLYIAGSIAFCCALTSLVAYRAAARMSRPGWLGDVLAPDARTNPGFGAEDLRGILLQLQFAFTFALLAAAFLVLQHARGQSGPAASTLSPRYVTEFAIGEHSTRAQRHAVQQQVRASLFAAGERGLPIATPGTLLGIGPTARVMVNCGRCMAANMLLPIFPLRTQHHVVGEGFFRTLGFDVHTGRDFSTSDTNARHVIVNDTFARLAFRGQPAVGKQIQVGGLRGDWYQVIGVARDLPITALLSFKPDPHAVVYNNTPGREPALYFYAGEKPPASFDVVTRTTTEIRLAGVSSKPARPLSHVLFAAHAPSRWFSGVLGGLAAAAAAVAIISLAAITLLNVRQRSLEIAARRAVGARRVEIIRLVLASALAVVGKGMFAGVILSVAVARAIQVILPQMALFDLELALLVGGILAAISLVAAAIPARAAARIPPAQVHV